MRQDVTVLEPEACTHYPNCLSPTDRGVTDSYRDVITDDNKPAATHIHPAAAEL